MDKIPSSDSIYIKISCDTPECEIIRSQGGLFDRLCNSVGLERSSVEEFVPEEYGLKIDDKGKIIDQ